MKSKQILLQVQKEKIENEIIDIIKEIEKGVRIEGLEVIYVIKDPIVKYKGKVIFSYE